MFATFAPGWTNWNTLYYSDSNDEEICRYSWAMTTFILMCVSTVVCWFNNFTYWVLDKLIHERFEKYGYSSTMRKASFGFLIFIILQIILILAALVIFTIGFVNENLPDQSLGLCYYLSWIAFGLYTIAGITWFIYVWKYFHEYDKDSVTGKCINCD
ncbi:hypothetical protein B9Z55_021553 [Caenorhabditis nigoni]|uniref:Uncharacterized protein n=1 Tax=Caenorhabditis nigoni TaxID=1611254 RepID=A0A2G5TSI9_9PELO|nr:hypothetical protein B9Z55_021553 [Caenorhabditis nigoni]